MVGVRACRVACAFFSSKHTAHPQREYEATIEDDIVTHCSTKAVFRSKRQNSKIFVNCLHDVLNIVEKNRIIQMDCKSRDEFNEPN